MKTIIFFICVLTVTLKVSAFCTENVKGIYKTAEEFINDSLSFSNYCNSNTTHIRLNGFFDKPYITIKQGGKDLRIKKAEIFGYKTCCDIVYRFNGKQQLLLLNADRILIYKYSASRPPSGRTNVTNYYFSVGPKEAVQKLTIKNIKAAFSLNKRFHQLVDEYFKYNTDLAKSDKTNKQYLINKLLKMSLTEV